MSQKVFVDTGAFFAKYAVRDNMHQRTMHCWKKLATEKWEIISTNFVLAETITLLSYHFGHQQAVQAAREIYSSKSLRIITVDLETELLAFSLLEQYADQEFSMTDATSFVTMNSCSIRNVFSFDADFNVAGFVLMG